MKHECEKTHWCEVCLKRYCEECSFFKLKDGKRFLLCPNKKCRLVDPTLTLIPIE